MAINQDFQRPDGMGSEETFSKFMMDLLNWAKAEEFDPSVEAFKKALEPTYGTGQTNTSLMTHVSRILLVISRDERFRQPLDVAHMEDLLCAPYRRIHQRNLQTEEDEKVTLTPDELVAGYVEYLATLIRNSPTRRLSVEDFKHKIDPTVIVLMRYVKKNGTKELTLTTLSHVLYPVYGLAVSDLADITKIVLNAYARACKEERFNLPHAEPDDVYSEILLAPVSGSYSLLGFGKRYRDLRPVEDVYMAMIKSVMGRFAIAQIDWCKELFE